MPMEWNPNILQCVAGFVPLAAWNTARVTGKGLHAAICELSTLDGLIGVCQDLVRMEKDIHGHVGLTCPFVFDASNEMEEAFAREMFTCVLEGIVEVEAEISEGVFEEWWVTFAVAIAPMSMKFYAKLFDLTSQAPHAHNFMTPAQVRALSLQCNSHIDSVADVDAVFEARKNMYVESGIHCPESHSLFSAARWVMRRLVHTYSFLYLHVEYKVQFDDRMVRHTILLYEKKTSGVPPR